MMYAVQGVQWRGFGRTALRLSTTRDKQAKHAPALEKHCTNPEAGYDEQKVRKASMQSTWMGPFRAGGKICLQLWGNEESAAISF